MEKRFETEEVKRRDFLGMMSAWTAVVAIVGMLIGMVRLGKPRLLPEASSTFSIGRPDEFPQGSEKVISQRNVMIVSTEKGIAAVSLVCTHLGCVVKPLDEGFICPCHGSKFSADGNVIGGPAPRALPWLEISRRADGKLLVNAKKEIEAGSYYQA